MLLLLLLCSSWRKGPKPWTAGLLAPTSRQPTHGASRACELADSLSGNAFDAFSCLFPASPALTLGMTQILPLVRRPFCRSFQPLVRPFALDQDAAPRSGVSEGRHAGDLASDHVRQMRFRDLQVRGCLTEEIGREA